ncbi:MAG: type II toxin-antitoxin system VapC family toxin [Alphaproteobacteria bacterium]|nr:type II toxin-antitoxin system VapC family toxin [Alphaproteobacteria bacterium]MCB9698561.1 type II toxin-antitoxin system VapC family toxin [Alphaproteobacteria bacterium]
MMALDTNVLVRLITKDDATETRQAVTLLLAGGPFWVSRVVLLELGWVLSSKRGPYAWDRKRVSDALHVIASLEGVFVEDQDRTRRALTWHRAGLDLGDAMVRAATPDEHMVVTFDRRFVSDAATHGVERVMHVTEATPTS